VPKKRRKLSAEHDKKIVLLKRDVELFIAKIGDIRDDELREEFKAGYRPVVNVWAFLRTEYDTNGFTEDLLTGFERYDHELEKFNSEYEF
jgi:hypothetical protein